MDIARSIDFDRLSEVDNKGASKPRKHHDIDVNRQFDVYTTGLMACLGEPPPIYQQHQGINSFTTRIAQESPKIQLSKPLCVPDMVRRTVVRTQHPPSDGEILSNPAAIENDLQDTTILCELSVQPWQRSCIRELTCS